ncbi:histidine kinase [Oceanidesulfovibrio indonesiensis]|uniref:Histidine kinase n=1 Tax=Oceanidesulfovibrio indonesiensis TaxID=54767 RepID=A0A7M3MHM2_9BACT|nr:HD domain-containing phosphohydrolase [Oceanidesulfovibrio indonesiensis]TVM18922.1 histidine kinase [Oceanidesulfovibrio indonesiensis]
MDRSRVLIVEDEPIVSMDIERRLKFMGYEVLPPVASGEDAVAQAHLRQPDIILMDIMLAGDMDGIEAASVIRDRKRVPVIYLTAYADEETLDRAQITEPFGYIIKPFEDRELKTCIHMALYKHKMEERLLENERWLSTTLRSIGDAVISTDRSGKVRYMNPMAEKLLGYPSKEAIGRPLDHVASVEALQNGCSLGDIVGNVLANGDGSRKETGTLHSAEGRKVPVEVSASTISSNRGENRLYGVVLVLRDMTEFVRAENALHQSVEDLRRTLEETVGALTLTTEKRDPYTAGHQQRVALLAGAIAKAMNLGEEQVEGIRVASLLHDIGKIYIPAEILSKPTMLTQIEMGMMKTHSEVGHDILKNVTFPWPVSDIVLQHHERLDGSGYPYGLMGTNILLEARIIMVADVVEAMSSHRPYRAALGVERALDEIGGNKDTRYDARVVDCCLELFRSGFRFEH